MIWFSGHVCVYWCVCICLTSAVVWVNPRKRANYRTALHAAMFISHLTFISKPRRGERGRGGGAGDTAGIGKVGSIRGNPSVCFLFPEPPLAERSARSERGQCTLKQPSPSLHPPSLHLPSLSLSSRLPPAMQRLAC